MLTVLLSRDNTPNASRADIVSFAALFPASCSFLYTDKCSLSTHVYMQTHNVFAYLHTYICMYTHTLFFGSKWDFLREGFLYSL